MIDQAQLSKLLSDIVENCMPGERMPFQIMKDTLIIDLYKGQNPTSQKYIDDHDQHAAHRMGAETAILALKFISVSWSTYKAIKEMIANYQKNRANLNHQQKLDSIKFAWDANLTSVGIPKEQANEITSKFAEQVLKILEEKYGR